jgi:hypothetical protein
MNGSSRRLPEPARSIARAVTVTVDAVRATDAEAFADGAAELAALDREQVGLVLGAVVRSLLEELHPDGLDGDDVRAVLEHCVRSCVGWFPDVDGGVLVVVLTGALGVHEPDAEPHPIPAPQLATHAPLLVADLLAATGRPLRGYLDTAFAEIMRAETMELP